MQLSIIIVNYNVKYFLEQCLYSVLKAVENINAEIIVADNNSTDDSKNFLEGRFCGVKFIWNTTNIGFAKANNAALKIARGEFILFLNPDTIVPEDCFLKCISFFKSQPGAGALGIHMIDGSGKFLKESKRSFPSPFISLYKFSGLASLFPKTKPFAKYHLGYLNENENHEVDVLAGAFLMSKKQIIDELGGFDESYFMYGEDVDLSYKIQKAGFKNFYFADSTIIHFKGESTKKGSLNYVRMFYKAMSIFVNKHYASGKVGVFNFIIQCAILTRAFFSATGRFIQWIGMPVIDAGTILLSFWFTKFIWNAYVRKQVSYSLNLLIVAFIIFTLIYLVASYFSGLYDKGYRQSKLNRSAIAAIVVLLAGYSLLPESLRFSRGILVFGSLVAYALITLMRHLLVSFKVLESYDEDEQNKTIIAGSDAEYSSVLKLMQSAGIKERLLGRVKVNGENNNTSIGTVPQLKSLFKIYPVKEIILCEGTLSFKQIIELVKTIPRNIRIKFHALNSESIIGSDSKNIAGNYVTMHSYLKLGTEVGKRNKHLADMIVSIILIVTFPLHLVLQKKPGRFFKNVLEVLLRNKTWVGYATFSKDLPSLKPGVLSVTSVPSFMNKMPDDSLILADNWYARHYTVWHDLQLVWKSYKLLYL